MDLAAVLKTTLDAIGDVVGLDLATARLVVGVSGGPDSLALLHALGHTIAPGQLIVAHLDHQLRPESAADATFVRQLAEAAGLDFYVKTVDVAQMAGELQQSLEEAGRLARYEFLADVARETGAAAVVTAHNADDQVETVLMHILRGSGLAGLRGMLPAMPLPNAPDIWLVRPLLQVKRSDIEDYCAAHGLQPLTDATNLDTTYFRNRLRHELLPLLESYSPQINRRLQNLANVVAADYELLNTLSAAAIEDLVVLFGPDWVLLNRRQWDLLPLSLRRSTLRSAVAQLAPELRDVGFATIEAARTMAEAQRSGQKAHLPGGVVLQVTADSLLLTKGTGIPPGIAPQLMSTEPQVLPVPGQVKLVGGLALVAELMSHPPLKQVKTNKDPWTAYVALEKSETLVVRPRRVSDRLQPLGLDGHSASLKKIMVNRKIPAGLRALWPVVATADHPVWLSGHLVDERHRVTGESKRIVRLICG